MKNLLLTILLFIIGCYIGYKVGYKNGIGNQFPTYGDTGLPKNCRALIQDNITNHKYGNYTAEEALYSIERNCGENGYIWNER